MMGDVWRMMMTMITIMSLMLMLTMTKGTTSLTSVPHHAGRRTLDDADDVVGSCTSGSPGGAWVEGLRRRLSELVDMTRRTARPDLCGSPLALSRLTFFF